MSHTLESTAQVLIEPALDLHAGAPFSRQPRAHSDFSRFTFLINHHHRTGQLTRLLASAPAPTGDDPTVTVVKVDTAEQPARLRNRLHSLKARFGDLIVVINSTQFNRPDIRSIVTAEEGVEVLIEEVNNFQPDQLRPWLAHLVTARIAARQARPVLATAPVAALPPPADPLDLSARLRDPANGRLDAKAIATLLGIPLTDLARLCGVSKQNLSQNPTSAGIQAALQTFDEIAQVLLWCGGSEAKLRAWLNRPNRDFPEVDGRKPSPLDLILRGHAELVAQKVHNLRTGQPS